MKNSNDRDLDKTLEIKRFNGNNASSQTAQGSPKKSNGKKGKSPHKRSRILAAILGTISGIGLLGVLIVSLLVVASIKEAPDVSAELLEQKESTIILSADGKVIYDTGAKIVENITYEDLPQSLVDAFLSIEDSRFFEHNGFDMPRFSMAMLANLKDTVTSLRLSFDGGGASTLDMQLVRNSVFMREDIETGETVMPATSGLAGIKRKIQEIFLATSISRDNILSKKSVFQMYVNRVNFGTGNNILGVQKSSEYYFGKDVRELTLIESAFLAGVVNSPSYVTPYYRLSNAKERTNTVLKYMRYHGYISDAEYENALNIPLENFFVDRSKSQKTFDYQSYIDVVLTEVEALTGKKATQVPMVIHTAMNVELQEKMDAVQRREVSRLDYGSEDKLQLASTIINNQTGEVVAIMGGYDYIGQRVFNLAYSGDIQPGSTVKPIVDYAPAFEFLGWATSHVMDDEPYNWGGTSFQVNNWDRRYEGQVTLRKAISDSRNIPAIHAFEAVQEAIGIQKYNEYVRSLGFNHFPEGSLNVQFGIGGSEFSTTVYELAGAYASVFNGGIFNSPHTVRRVDFKDGSESITDTHTTRQVLSDAAAYMTAETMRNVIIDNMTITARPTRRSYTVYGKTGTTNYAGQEAINAGAPEGASKDLLIVNATDQYTFASWSGYAPANRVPENKPWLDRDQLTFNLPGYLNSYILDALYEQFGAGKEIARPSSVSDITHILGTFPYQAPISGMDQALVATGLIKKDRLSLVEAAPPTLESLQSATLTVTKENGRTKVSTHLAAYPDATKLIVASDVLEMTAQNGSKYVGRRLFDPSWIFGAVRYQADLVIDGTVVETKHSGSESIDFTLPANASGSIQVCSYYTFEKNQDKRSESICNTVDSSQITVQIPSKFDSIQQLNAFAGTYGVNIVSKYTTNSSLSQYGSIRSVSPNQLGQSVTASSLRGTTWNVDVNDYVVDASSYVNKQLKTFSDSFGDYFYIQKEGTSDTIDSIYSANNTLLNQFRISEHEGKTIIVKTR